MVRLDCWTNLLFRNRGDGSLEKSASKLAWAKSAIAMARRGRLRPGRVRGPVRHTEESKQLLYRNRGDGTFEQITAGLSSTTPNSTGILGAITTGMVGRTWP